MSKKMNLRDAVKMIPSWAKIYLGGFKLTRCPMVFAQEMIRQKKHDLTVYAGTLGLHHELLVKAGIISRLECAYGGINEDTVWENIALKAEDREIKIEDFSLGAMAARFQGGAMNVPFMPIKSMIASGLQGARNYLKKKEKFMLINCPFSFEIVGLVESIKPEVAVISAQKGDKEGNFVIQEELGMDIEALKAAKVAIVMVEEIIPTEELTKILGTHISGMLVDVMIEMPKSAYPSAMPGYYPADSEIVNKLINTD